MRFQRRARLPAWPLVSQLGSVGSHSPLDLPFLLFQPWTEDEVCDFLRHVPDSILGDEVGFQYGHSCLDTVGSHFPLDLFVPLIHICKSMKLVGGRQYIQPAWSMPASPAGMTTRLSAWLASFST
jgi:hypothetical protein